MFETGAAILAWGQQVLQQQSGQEGPTVCFAAIPLVVPAAVIFARATARRLRRLAAGAA
ncbi:MAG: hypothetical protein U0821_04460 [Chloroflexota bacterium]